jgi:hypothetical protein
MALEDEVRIPHAIKAINPDAKFTITETGNVDTAEITWLEGFPEISKADIQEKFDELKAEYEAQDYARKRQAEYPDIYDYMDGIVKSDQAQIDKYIADCQAVKDKYSKGI